MYTDESLYAFLVLIPAWVFFSFGGRYTNKFNVKLYSFPFEFQLYLLTSLPSYIVFGSG